jgi:hypothetical protein
MDAIKNVLARDNSNTETSSEERSISWEVPLLLLEVEVSSLLPVVVVVVVAVVVVVNGRLYDQCTLTVYMS